MAIRKMEELVQNGLDRAIELIVLAAHNSYRFAARNTLKIIVAGKEEMEQIAQFAYSMADMSPLAARDGRHVIELIKEPCALIIFGDTRKSPFNYNCGACGFRTCAELNRSEPTESLMAEGPSCQFKNLNLNIAVNAAAAMAWRLGLYNRVFSTLAFGARALEIIEDVDIVVTLSVSAAKRDPYFDRHQFWTDDYWDEIFEKEFPTYTRGFIGAIED
ncbi:MAG: DUF2148 domain-containing protein [Dethiobacteria bacterium]|jgi:uncharacterized ferredoxin-like protein|nr:DUF2148 domain-containing protein [Bacillota bacterium]NMD32772.1 hypothetical protein [Bacillota bacterium]HOB28832.1 DUF2148 domain-containing protein [Bacillota bacterium]HPZ41586.1 DUF2148 domain-containing protein [Bacillota bacterium]HQD51571.1 DUF2148 domain-containing protein [Bacillota bacterium]